MSRAEEEANKRYGITRGDDTQDTSGIDMQRASDFIDGYNQAEKDLELTAEDIKKIYFLFKDVTNEWFGHEFSDYGICREVLKRFNEKRNERYE